MSMSKIRVQGQLLLENQEAAARDRRTRTLRFKFVDDVCLNRDSCWGEYGCEYVE